MLTDYDYNDHIKLVKKLWFKSRMQNRRLKIEKIKRLWV